MAASSHEYKARLVDSYLDELIRQLPALLVLGARATGKTTTMARRARTIIRLDQPREAAAFAADPDSALRDLPEPVLLDEWQNVPVVLGAVRRAVDRDPRPGRFFVTGSARAELDNEVWPATGRITRLAMYPMTVAEEMGLADEPNLFDVLASGQRPRAPSETPDLRAYVELALRSGFPFAALRLDGLARTAWFASYLDDLLSHDIQLLEDSSTRRRDPQRLRRYFEAYALNSAGVTDHRTIYDAAQVNSHTATAYDGLLTDLFVVEQVPAWSSNRLKRVTRRPKRYLTDAALIATALRLDTDAVMRNGDLLGRIIDTFVVAQLRPQLALSTHQPRLHHLRTEKGLHEVDLIAELSNDRVIAIEIKAGAAPSEHDARHLAWLRDELGDRFVSGVLFHTGPRVFELAERIVAMPISTLWATETT